MTDSCCKYGWYKVKLLHFGSCAKALNVAGVICYILPGKAGSWEASTNFITRVLRKHHIHLLSKGGYKKGRAFYLIFVLRSSKSQGREERASSSPSVGTAWQPATKEEGKIFLSNSWSMKEQKDSYISPWCPQHRSTVSLQTCLDGLAHRLPPGERAELQDLQWVRTSEGTPEPNACIRMPLEKRPMFIPFYSTVTFSSGIWSAGMRRAQHLVWHSKYVTCTTMEIRPALQVEFPGVASLVGAWTGCLSHSSPAPSPNHPARLTISWRKKFCVNARANGWA